MSNYTELRFRAESLGLENTFIDDFIDPENQEDILCLFLDTYELLMKTYHTLQVVHSEHESQKVLSKELKNLGINFGGNES